MSWDIHQIGGYVVTSPDDNRIPRAFRWEYPSPTSGYTAHLAAGLAPETYDGTLYDNPTQMLSILWFDLATTALTTAINAALAAITPGDTWSVQPAGLSTAYSCKVLGVTHSEAYEAEVDGRRGTAIDFTLVCTPGWYSAEESQTPTPPSSLPGVYTLAGLKGSMPAPFRMRLTNDQATTSQTVGFKHSPDAAAVFIQDYQGTADADALSTQSAQGTMDADGVALGTPTTLTAAAMRGWYLPCIRVDQPDATVAHTTYFATSTVTGSGMAGTGSFVTGSTPATVASAYEHIRLDPLPIPGGPVPDVDTGSGWAAEAVAAEQTTDSGSYTGASNPGQSFTVPVGDKIVAVVYTFDADTGATSGYLHISGPIHGVNIVPPAPLSSVDFTAGTHKLYLGIPVISSGSGVYSFWLDLTGASSYQIAHNAAGGYAGGQMYGDSAAITGKDLVFKVYAQAPLGFNCTVGISAANSGGGTGALDTVALVPNDEFSCCIEDSCGATEGVLIDASDPDAFTVYTTDTGGNIEPLDQDGVEPAGAARVWPGDTAVVYDAYGPDDPPTGGDMTIWYTPTYLTPYGG